MILSQQLTKTRQVEGVNRVTTRWIRYLTQNLLIQALKSCGDLVRQASQDKDLKFAKSNAFQL